MRLIDADALMEKSGWYNLLTGKCIHGVQDYEIASMPTIDAVPVVHGRWIDEGAYVTTAYGSLDVYQCSNCNREITIDDYDNYCPNCGARMDGGEKE